MAWFQLRGKPSSEPHASPIHRRIYAALGRDELTWVKQKEISTIENLTYTMPIDCMPDTAGTI